MHKPEVCKCIFSKGGFFHDEVYYYSKLDKDSFKVFFDYGFNKNDYELINSRTFHSRFKKDR